MAVVDLSIQFIQTGLQCPEGRSRIEFVDVSRSGIYIEVRKATPGQGLFYYRTKSKVTGKTTHYPIGSTKDITLEDAKAAVQKLKYELSAGIDKRAEEHARLKVITFDDFFKEHFLPYIKPRIRSWKRSEQIYRLHIEPVFGHRRLNDVTRLEIQKLHADQIQVNKLTPASANHLAKVIRRMLSLAVEWSIIEKNVASRIKMFNEDNQIERYLNEDELQRLLEVLSTDRRRVVCQIALFLLSTGARLNEALTARWEHIDVEKKLWRVPAQQNKSKRSKVIPLNDSAIEVIASLNTKGAYEHLFINKRTKLPYVNIAKIWHELRLKAGLNSHRLHDLRHSYASFLANAGQSLYVIQQILGHSDPSVTQRYAHLSMTALQTAANSASRQIQAAQPKAA
ncbi:MULTISPECIES: site-specific integrase [unclassified Methylophilus]|uniref:site-specific integrase n=1 Tax=unclassified Methylophilus TaxID=2630143 RepID=UPI0006FB44AA|nr:MULTISPECIES: site-specific integrase [unclassified Methylophilus]KQT42509.1 hypothetical protein ASG34_07135 [Methylophilus sp. Leaf416]KQT56692.1 hypothetical protein ASG44_07110 [Methylophilus sp. Leaf459]